MDYRKNVNKILLVLRVAFLGLFLFATLVVGAWIFWPQAVNDVGKWFAQIYEKSYSDRFEKCRTLLKIKSKEGSECFEDFLLEEIPKIKPPDRAAVFMSAAFPQVVSEYQKNGDFEKADYWLNQWLAFDDRDLIAKVAKVKVYLSFPEKRQQGINLAKDLYSHFPDVQIVSNIYDQACLFAEKSEL